MANISNHNTVLIIGAGPGGLVLAQILRRHGIPFEIFERDPEPNSRQQGWDLALIECIPDLIELLPDDIKDVRAASANFDTGKDDSIAMMDALTGKHLATMGGVARGNPGYILRARRQPLRDMLLEHLTVSFNKNFSHYTEDVDGITACFHDGTSARGSILVGADGAHSHVRAALLSGQQSVPSEFEAIVGEVRLPPRLFEPILERATSAILVHAPRTRCVFSLHSMEPDRSSARFFWILIHRSEEDLAAELAHQQTASKQSLYEKAIDLSADMVPMFADIIRHTGPDGVATPPFKLFEYVPPATLPGNRITLLGDAAHTMLPFRGAGGNAAIMDACDLARLIIKAAKDGIMLGEVLKQYEDVAVARGRGMISVSRVAGEDISVFVRSAQEQEKLAS